MSGIMVEVRKRTILTGISDGVKDLVAASDIRPVRLSFGQAPFASQFLRLYPYRMENFTSQFDFDGYKQATETLTRFFGQCLDNPDGSYQGEVNLTIDDYKGRATRRARHYLSERGIDVYLLESTQLELKSAVIPAPEDINVLKQHPVATVMAIKGSYILSGRLFNGNIYPPVNDFGNMHSLDQLDNTGGYQHLELSQLGDVFS